MFEKEDHCEREMQSIRRQSIVKGKGLSIGLLCIIIIIIIIIIFVDLKKL